MNILSHPDSTSILRPQTAAGVAANDATSNSQSSPNSSSATSTATITANDFLQLLVTELQNQDPTANTDPNEYVDQLVQVNSLQQQIQMNQTLDGGPTLTGASSGVLQQLMQMNQTFDGDVASAGTSPDATHAKTHAAATTGNLSAAPSTNTANTQGPAERISTALAPNSPHAPEGGQTQAFEEFAARLKTSAAVK